MGQIVGHGSGVEVVYHPPFAAGSRPLHLLPGAPHVQRHPALAVNDSVGEGGFAGRFAQRHPRAAERPTRAGGHVYLNVVAPALVLGVAKHLHPLGREVSNVVALVALHTVDGRYLHRSHAGAGILLHVPCQIGLVHSRTEPPPTQPGARFGGG